MRTSYSYSSLLALAGIVAASVLTLTPAFALAAFDRDLRYGDRGPDVVEMQEFLQAQELFSGEITGNFFSLTLAAVKAFQVREHITPISGFWGPITQAAARAVLGGATAQNNPPQQQQGGSTTQELLAMIAALQAQIAALQNGQGTTQQQGAIPVTPPVNPVAAQNSPCMLNGQSISHGQSIIAYQVTSVAAGTSCSSVSESRLCTNGTLSGSYPYTQCTTAASAPSTATTTPATNTSCTFNGQTVAHGQSVTAYQTSSVAVGSQCASQSRTCTNGVLSGRYTYAACSVAIPQNLYMPTVSGGTTIGSTYLNNHSVTGGKAPYTYTLLSGALPPGIVATPVNDGSILRIEGTNRDTYPVGVALTGVVRYSKWRVTDAAGANFEFNVEFTSYYPNLGAPGRIAFTSNGSSYDQHPYSSTIRVGQTNTYAWSSTGTTGCAMSWDFYPTGGGAKQSGSLGNLKSSDTLVAGPLATGDIGQWYVTLTCPLSGGGSAPAQHLIVVIP